MGVDKKVEKKPYGLIYSVDTNGNPDGKLCVTLRNDDVPFKGVASFAVEEGTENKIAMEGYAAQDWTKWSHWNNATYWQSCSQYDDKKWGKVFKGISKSVSYIFDYFPYSVSKNAQYVFSVYIKNDFPGAYLMRAYIIDSNHNLYAENIQTVTVTQEWQRFIFKLSPSADVGNAGIGIRLNYGGEDLTGITWWFAYPQLEQKPFATSFVDGSRIDGRVIVPEITLSDNLVISFWVKIASLTTSSVSAHGGFARWINFAELGDGDTKDILGFGYYRKESYINSEKFGILFKDHDGNSNWFATAKNAEARKWYFVTVRVTSTNLAEMIIYDENGYYDSVAVTQDFSSIFGKYLMTGRTPGAATTDIPNSLISNLYIGKAKVGDKLIWNDDYIKQLYQAKRPFSVPPKMPVGII